MENKGIIITIVLIVIIIGIIFTINYTRANGNHEKDTMQCIANNSILIVSKTCGHCANQIEILGDSSELFKILYVDDDPSLFERYNLRGVPSWIINDKTYTGVKSIEKLKELIECK